MINRMTPQEVLELVGFYCLGAPLSLPVKIGDVIERSMIESTALADDVSLVIIGAASEEDWTRQSKLMTGCPPLFYRDAYWKATAE